MKKLLVGVGVVAMGFAFTSCTKDCVCTGEYGVEGLMQKVDQTFPDVKSADCKDDMFQLPAGFVKPEGFKNTIKCESK